MQVTENTAEHLWEVIYSGNNFFEHFFFARYEKRLYNDFRANEKTH
jgi:hypothetical protein